MRRLLQAVCVCAAVLCAGPAAAHPHVWVTMTSEVMYAPDGSLWGVRHVWAFDAMYSTFATQGLQSKQKGVFTRDELAPLAASYIGSLAEFDYFTFARIDGEKVPLGKPTEYWLEFRDGALELTLVLPLARRKPAAQTIEFDVHDPSTYVDLVFGEGTPVTLAGAPASCKGAFARRDENLQSISAERPFFDAAPTEYGSRILNKIRVRCS